jgi:hypothetical protein
MPESFDSLPSGFGPIECLLWLAGAVALAVILSPFLVSACGGTRLRFWATKDPAAVKPDGGDPEYEEAFQELVALGFRPCGVVSERVWFSGHHIRRTAYVRTLVSADGLTFASLYRLGGWGVVLRVSFATLTDRRTLIQTASPGAGLVRREPDYHRTEVPEGELEEVYARHRSEVQAVTAAGGGEAIAASLDEYARADETRSARTVARLGASDLAFLPVFAWGLPFAGCLALLWAASPLDWPQLVGWSLVFAACCYAVAVVKGMPLLLRLCELDPRATEGPDE